MCNSDEEYRIEFWDFDCCSWELYDVTSDRQDAFEIYNSIKEESVKIVDSSTGEILAEREKRIV